MLCNGTFLQLKKKKKISNLKPKYHFYRMLPIFKKFCFCFLCAKKKQMNDKICKPASGLINIFSWSALLRQSDQTCFHNYFLHESFVCLVMVCCWYCRSQTSQLKNFLFAFSVLPSSQSLWIFRKKSLNFAWSCPQSNENMEWIFPPRNNRNLKFRCWWARPRTVCPPGWFVFQTENSKKKSSIEIKHSRHRQSK